MTLLNDFKLLLRNTMALAGDAKGALADRLSPDPQAVVILSCAIILLAGFMMTRLTKKAKLPNVTGYILAGVLIGPSLLGLVPADLVAHMGFLSDLALAMIALEVGRSFQLKKIKKHGTKAMIVTLCESLLAALLVTLVLYFGFRLPFDLSLLLGTVASATAPASTVMTIRQYNAKGPFVDLLLQVAAMDDAVCLLLYSLAIAIVNAGHHGSWRWRDFAMPVLLNLLALGLGVLFGLLWLRLMPARRSRDNRLIVSLALIMALTGLCALLEVSPLLAVMVMSAIFVNRDGDENLYDEINAFTPPLMSAFFVVSGMNMNIASLGTLGIIGVVYFIVRILGKYLGARLGTKLTGQPAPIGDNLGFALIPQAGVAIGLAMMGRRVLPPAAGHLLVNIILASSVLYEMVGPVAAKFAMRRAGVLNPSTNEQKKAKEKKVSREKHGKLVID